MLVGCRGFQMQTFLPFPDFVKSAHSLDRARLGNQRKECKQIYNSLKERGGWYYHPAVQMWKGYEQALVHYALEISNAWVLRGYHDMTWAFWTPLRDKSKLIMPWWLGIDDFHRSHRSNLIQKFPEWYRDGLGWSEPVLGYWWPTEHSIGK